LPLTRGDDVETVCPRGDLHTNHVP
jgi:hypothetical protein